MGGIYPHPPLTKIWKTLYIVIIINQSSRHNSGDPIKHFLHISKDKKELLFFLQISLLQLVCIFNASNRHKTTLHCIYPTTSQIFCLKNLSKTFIMCSNNSSTEFPHSVTPPLFSKLLTMTLVS